MAEEISRFEEFDDKNSVRLTDSEVFAHVWTQPKRVFNFILKYNYERYFYLLLFLSGVSTSLERILNKDKDYSLLTILLISVLAGGLLGWISTWIYAGLVSWTGRWIGGRGSSNQFFQLFAYASLPAVAAIPLLLISVMMQQVGSFDFEDSTLLISVAIVSTSALILVLQIWKLYLYITAVSVVQKFGFWKSLWNLLMPVLLFVVPLVLIFLALR